MVLLDLLIGSLPGGVVSTALNSGRVCGLNIHSTASAGSIIVLFVIHKISAFQVA